MAFPVLVHQFAQRVSPYLGLRKIPLSLSDFLLTNFYKELLSAQLGWLRLKKTYIGKLQKSFVTKCRLELAVWHVLNLNRKLIHYGLASAIHSPTFFFMSIERESA